MGEFMVGKMAGRSKEPKKRQTIKKRWMMMVSKVAIRSTEGKKVEKEKKMSGRIERIEWKIRANKMKVKR